MRYNLNLGALRGIGAILIFLHHSGIKGSIIASFGDFGVSLFMMLSGFILSASYNEKKESIPNFMKKRIRKIYPVYFLSLIAALTIKILTSTKISTGATILDFLLLQSWIPRPDVYFSGNAVAWFLSSLMFSYLIFLPARQLISKAPVRSLIYMTVVLTFYFLLLPLIPIGLETPIVYIFPPMETVVFLIGMIIWEFFGKAKVIDRLSVTVQLAIQIICITIAICQILGYKYIPEVYALSSYWWIADILILLVFTLSDTSLTPITYLLHTKPMQFFGRISLTFYLLHYLIFDIYDSIFATSIRTSLFFFVKIIVCFFLTVLVSIIVNKVLTPKKS